MLLHTLCQSSPMPNHTDQGIIPVGCVYSYPWPSHIWYRSDLQFMILPSWGGIYSGMQSLECRVYPYRAKLGVSYAGMRDSDVWRAIPHKITELVKKTKITPAHWRNFSSLLEISPAYSRFLQPTGEISPAHSRFLQPTGEISPVG